MSHNTLTASLAVTAGTLLFCTPAQAETTTLNAQFAGWYSHAGEHNPHGNYAVGGGADGLTRHNYFIFDRSGITGGITAATLRIYNPNQPASLGSAFGYTSADASENYRLFDVAKPAEDLAQTYAAGSQTGLAIFADLGSGAIFGDYQASLADNGTYVDIPLNAAGLSMLSATSGAFAIGGAITTLDNLVNPESLFASGFFTPLGSTAHLVVSTVPEPSQAAMLLAGLGLVGLVWRRNGGRSAPRA